MSAGLEAGFLLDRQWHWLRGETEESKRPALLALGRVLGDAQVAYAIIRGLALQVHQQETRTTLDIDVAVVGRDSIPREALTSAGFPVSRELRTFRELGCSEWHACPVHG
jgi:hypothetical protein